MFFLGYILNILETENNVAVFGEKKDSRRPSFQKVKHHRKENFPLENQKVNRRREHYIGRRYRERSFDDEGNEESYDPTAGQRREGEVEESLE